jgi:hypothetical protein
MVSPVPAMLHDVIDRARLGLAAFALSCGPTDNAVARERMTGGGSVNCVAQPGGGQGYGGFGRDLDVVLLYENATVTFEGLWTLVCPLVGTHEDNRFDFPFQDCTEGDYDELAIRGFGEWRDELLVLELESDEYHGTFDDPAGPRYPVPCEHHYELVPVED